MTRSVNMDNVQTDEGGGFQQCPNITVSQKVEVEKIFELLGNDIIVPGVIFQFDSFTFLLGADRS